MQLKDPKTIIKNLYHSRLHKEQNVVYAEKLFIVNTIINFLFKNKTYKEIDQFQIARYGEYIHKYFNDEVDIFWKDGILMIRELESGDIFMGG